MSQPSRVTEVHGAPFVGIRDRALGNRSRTIESPISQIPDFPIAEAVHSQPEMIHSRHPHVETFITRQREIGKKRNAAARVQDDALRQKMEAQYLKNSQEAHKYFSVLNSDGTLTAVDRVQLALHHVEPLPVVSTESDPPRHNTMRPSIQRGEVTNPDKQAELVRLIQDGDLTINEIDYLIRERGLPGYIVSNVIMVEKSGIKELTSKGASCSLAEQTWLEECVNHVAQFVRIGLIAGSDVPTVFANYPAVQNALLGSEHPGPVPSRKRESRSFIKFLRRTKDRVLSHQSSPRPITPANEPYEPLELAPIKPEVLHMAMDDLQKFDQYSGIRLRNLDEGQVYQLDRTIGIILRQNAPWAELANFGITPEITQRYKEAALTLRKKLDLAHPSPFITNNLLNY